MRNIFHKVSVWQHIDRNASWLSCLIFQLLNSSSGSLSHVSRMHATPASLRAAHLSGLPAQLPLRLPLRIVVPLFFQFVRPLLPLTPSISQACLGHLAVLHSNFFVRDGVLSWRRRPVVPYRCSVSRCSWFLFGCCGVTLCALNYTSCFFTPEKKKI